ncbi:hypothetical protein [Streptomyces sp. NRRL S-1813]|uniref:hypothetical protein n=1 Tax=Streptomyces sp. NRRL S-1813 TaxID=1463888 RepID=UPI000ABD01FB|nr:hypothetical protein [Streptomyces sp. NRRL S-1813]
MAADEEWAVTLICEWGGCRRVERFESRRTVRDGRRFPEMRALVAPGHAKGPQS